MNRPRLFASLNEPDVIFTCYAKDRSPLEAAEFFAATYFVFQAKMERFWPVSDHWIFGLIDDDCRYRLDYVPETQHGDKAAYTVSRMTTPLSDDPPK